MYKSSSSLNIADFSPTIYHFPHMSLPLLNINNSLYLFTALMKLGRAANLSPRSRVKTIFLPSSTDIRISPNDPPTTTSNDNDLFDRNENYLRKIEPNVNNLVNLIAEVNQNEIKKRQGVNRTQHGSRNETRNGKKKHRRRNDKFLHRRPTTNEDYLLFNRDKFAPPSSIDYLDCVAVGWGKYRNSGDLSDVLLKIEVPIQNIKRYFVIAMNGPITLKNSSASKWNFWRLLKPFSFFRCEEVYSDFVSLHQNQHLCAGNMDGRGGTCVTKMISYNC